MCDENCSIFEHWQVPSVRSSDKNEWSISENFTNAAQLHASLTSRTDWARSRSPPESLSFWAPQCIGASIVAIERLCSWETALFVAVIAHAASLQVLWYICAWLRKEANRMYVHYSGQWRRSRTGFAPQRQWPWLCANSRSAWPVSARPRCSPSDIGGAVRDYLSLLPLPAMCFPYVVYFFDDNSYYAL